LQKIDEKQKDGSLAISLVRL